MKLWLSMARYYKILNQTPTVDYLRALSVNQRSFHASSVILSAFEPLQVEQQVASKYNLTPDKLKRHRIGFEKFDLNKDGRITKAEFKMAAHNLGIKQFAVQQMEVWFQNVDRDGSGEIEFDEYVHLMENETCGWLGMVFSDEKSMVDFCFQSFDRFNDGYLTKDQVAKMLAYIRGSTTEQEVKEFMAKVNKSHDGRLTPSELLDHFLKKA